ncbi:integral membrane protein 2A-like [Erpetoichthys calabaricus]|uniref:Integral membrane protein 2 n=1 Tax=Erpetoichthys calabaricus TaxID=27687 RepID=A0A8C4XCA4_ERPCA|nr:integral membrane protein 2A-like [Erpetoichthys calabaricus]
MVKIVCNTALMQKGLVKEAEGLVPEKDPETAAVYTNENSTGRCLLTLLGLAFILTGLIVGGACVYRYFIPKHKVYHGGMHYAEQGNIKPLNLETREPYYLPMIDEEMEIRDNVAIIKVPVPRFADTDPAAILHDFDRKLTAYLDLKLSNCYVIPLNTSVVMPPRDLLDLFIELMTASYNTYLIHEDLVVTERIDDITELGFYIYELCEGKDTYKMQRRNEIIGLQKRSAPTCLKIRHFENIFVTETNICKA